MSKTFSFESVVTHATAGRIGWQRGAGHCVDATLKANVVTAIKLAAPSGTLTGKGILRGYKKVV